MANECKNCVHWVRIPESEDVGNCRRFPRVFVQEEKGGVKWFFPMQFDNDFCGEFKVRIG